MSLLYKHPLIPVICLWVIIFVAMYLRVNRADEFPIYQNDDGLFHVWAGNSILDNFFHPTSLTIFDTNNAFVFWRSHYKNLIPADRFGFRLTDPWFDQPFLATILIAMPARIMGYTHFEQIPHFLVRLPSLFAALFTLLLLYKLGSALFNGTVGLLATAVYGLWPLVIFANRQSYLENFVTVFWLLGLWIVWKNQAKLSTGQIVLLIICTVAAGWSKLVGYMAGISFVYWLLRYKHFREAKILVFTLAMSALMYGLYGLAIGREAFIQTILHQGSRGSYPSSIMYYVLNPEVKDILNDGWWLIALAASVWLLAFKADNATFLTTNIGFWWSVLFLVSGPENTSPWYKNPMLPLIALATGKFIYQWWQKPSLPATLPICFLGFTGWELAGVMIPSLSLRIAVIIIAGIFSLPAQFVRFQRSCIIVLLLLMGWGNIMAVLYYPTLRCQDNSCPPAQKIYLPSS